MEDVLSFGFKQLKVSVLNKLDHINCSTNRYIPTEKPPRKNQGGITSPKDNLKESSPQSKQSEIQFQGLLDVFEHNRRQEVINKVQARLKKFEDFTVQQELNKKEQWFKKQQEFVEDLQQQEKNINQALQEYDKNSSYSQAQLALYYKDLELKRQAQENEIKRREYEKQLLYKCIDKIKKLQPEFLSLYEKILKTIKRCQKIENLKAQLTEDFQLLNSLPSSFDEIIKSCKNAKVTEDDVKNAQDMFIQLQNIERKINETVDSINKINEQANIPKPTPLPVESKPLVATPKPVARSQSAASIEKYINLDNFHIYSELMDFLDKYTESIKNLENDVTQKQFMQDCKKAINIPVNSLSGVNAEHVLDKFNKLFRLLKGQDNIIADKRINASIHPQGIQFCKNLLAKRFVLQSDLIISSNSESAFCYATVIVSLWNEFPDFGKLILAYFYKVCPYLVPYNVPRQEGESDEEYYQRQGYQYSNGQIEKQDKYLKRMTGVMRLYSAIMIVKPKRGCTNIYNIQNGWKWLTSTLKLEPEVDITATLVHTFLETAGFEMEACYGKMFKKLLQIIMGQFLPSCKQKCTGGALTRLELLLEDYLHKQKFESPDGYLGYTYW
ncbi:mRNA export factor Gle1 [Diabrotica undecimpunctata]|uniref:mRNA export factor Gle1 n=1 Tax=Diabrotica undecimpunctata TaxID=50387 RepID=UPI003B63F2F6